jgi:hypothetical protein
MYYPVYPFVQNECSVTKILALLWKSMRYHLVSFYNQPQIFAHTSATWNTQTVMFYLKSREYWKNRLETLVPGPSGSIKCGEFLE